VNCRWRRGCRRLSQRDRHQPRADKNGEGVPPGDFWDEAQTGNSLIPNSGESSAHRPAADGLYDRHYAYAFRSHA
jgi:hypothetical protein